MSATQDMPPPGGFASIKIERTFARPIIRQGFWYLALLGLSINGTYVISEWRKRYKVARVEQMEHYIASEPFLLVEQERKFLRQLRILREDERELMKDHPGWKIGTLYGEPVFKTLPEGKLPPISPIDWTPHRPSNEWFIEHVMPDQHQ